MIQLVCCLSTWVLIFTSIWKLYSVLKSGILYMKKIHNIPCSNCQFFTGDYRLKCTVNPIDAMTESALSCRDFELSNRY
jgi:hypothetical protein